MNQQQTITDHRPYYVPATYNWMAENFRQIYISFLKDHEGVECMPCAFKTEQFGVQGEDGSVSLRDIDVITLNFGAEAVGNITLTADSIKASVRFGGKLANVTVPFLAIKRMYSPDRMDLGMFMDIPFNQADLPYTQQARKAAAVGAQTKDIDAPAQPVSQSTPSGNRPTLTRVK